MRALLLLLFSFWLTSVTFAGQLQDPTRPQFANPKAPTQVSEYELNAIILSVDRRIAVINGKSLRVGDMVEDAKVVAIEPNTVQLLGSNGRITLTLLNQSVRQEASAS
jgi:MSHA biogenesis protein MshK